VTKQLSYAIMNTTGTRRKDGPEQTHERTLAHNTIWNLSGYAAPLLAALIAIPILIRNLGTAQYGALTIAWGVVGYFSVFDMGLDNALAKLVSERVGVGGKAEKEINSFFYTAFLLLLISSVIGGVLVFAFSRPLSYGWLKIPLELKSETTTVLRIFAFALPFAVSVAGFRGILYAYQRFDLLNKVQIAAGAFSFLGPLAVLPFSRRLVPVVAVLAIGRALAWLAYGVLCFHVAPDLKRRVSGGSECVRELAKFGGWISISNVAEPMFLYSDRLILGALLSMSAVAFYAIPFDLVIRLWIIPDALNSALFPTYVISLRDGGRRAMMLFEKASRYLFLTMFPPVLFVMLFATDLLSIWIGPEFAAHSALVMKWLALGVFFSSMGRIPWTMLLAAHRPDIPAKLVLFEAPVYIALLCFLVKTAGLPGAALAWTIRAVWNCCVLHAVTSYVLPASQKAIGKNVTLLAVATIFLATTLLFAGGLGARIAYFVALICAEILLGWFCLLSPEDREIGTGFVLRIVRDI
jgi:O-antigen/teichoic acid export membrane protein